MQDKDELDLLLDSALATYADPGPESGLEQRVLTALASARNAGEGRKTRRWLAWAIAAPIAASLLLWLGIARFKHVVVIQQNQASQSHPSASPGVPPLASESHPAIDQVLKGHGLSRAAASQKAILAVAPEGTSSQSARIDKPAPLRKLDVFPTPQPLTPQERALSAMTTQAPVPLRKALIEAQEQDDTSVRIAAIHIPPIEPPSQTQP